MPDARSHLPITAHLSVDDFLGFARLGFAKVVSEGSFWFIVLRVSVPAWELPWKDLDTHMRTVIPEPISMSKVVLPQTTISVYAWQLAHEVFKALPDPRLHCMMSNQGS